MRKLLTSLLLFIGVVGYGQQDSVSIESSTYTPTLQTQDVFTEEEYLALISEDPDTDELV